MPGWGEGCSAEWRDTATLVWVKLVTLRDPSCYLVEKHEQYWRVLRALTCKRF